MSRIPKNKLKQVQRIIASLSNDLEKQNIPANEIKKRVEKKIYHLFQDELEQGTFDESWLNNNLITKVNTTVTNSLNLGTGLGASVLGAVLGPSFGLFSKGIFKNKIDDSTELMKAIAEEFENVYERINTLTIEKDKKLKSKLNAPVAREKQKFNAEEIFEKTKPNIVTIESENGSGSGVFVSDNGIIATNRHVVGKEKKVIIRLSDSNEIDGKVIRSFNPPDLAFIKVNMSKHTKAYCRLNHQSKEGQIVFAMGSPLALHNSITDGIVSSVGRLLGKQKYIQHNAAINEGNSGGPLLNEQGEVVGLNTLSRKEAQGIYFAIHAKIVNEKLNSITNLDDNIVYCNICGYSSKADSKYCENCGVNFNKDSESNYNRPSKELLTSCKTCKTEHNKQEHYCNNCGTKLLVERK